MMSSRITVEDLRDAYDAGVQDSMLRATQYERILQDLIAELRAVHHAHACTDPEDYPCCCQECREHWPCSIEAVARSAERRLREVQGE